MRTGVRIVSCSRLVCSSGLRLVQVVGLVIDFANAAAFAGQGSAIGVKPSRPRPGGNVIAGGEGMADEWSAIVDCIGLSRQPRRLVARHEYLCYIAI